MKKLRHRIIFFLIVIYAFSSSIAGLLTTPLIPYILTDTQPWIGDILKTSFQNAIALIIFTLFVVLGAREITAPVVRLSEAANRIAGGDFDVKLPETRRKDEIGQLENSFRVMAKGLRSTEYLQKDFISNVSHEYKTPLAVISGYVKLMCEDGLPHGERTMYGDFILDEANRLSEMTSSILLLSKLENQSIQPVFTHVSLDEQLRQAILLYYPKFQEKNITLDINMPSMDIVGSDELLPHIWTNLLENAMKFTGVRGAVYVRGKIVDDTSTISISDNGIGMDEETLEHVFDQFYQGDASRQGVGSGLGLSLVRRIVDLHGGSVRAESQVGIGTTFSVTLPVYPQG